MDSDEITPEKIRASAKKLGIRIASDTCFNSTKKCGCPLFILSADTRGIDYANSEVNMFPMNGAFASMLDLCKSFVDGFIRGFDKSGHGFFYKAGLDLDYDEGYQKGQNIRNELNSEVMSFYG
jgi:hypothetical protein